LPCGIAVRRGFRPANGIIQRAAHGCDNVVISIRSSSADAVSVFAPGGTESTFATGFSNARGIAFDPSGNLLVAELKELSTPGDILKFSMNGSQTVFASGIGQPKGNGGPEFLGFCGDPMP
jgi:glucose/arabinose dehydrogenase